MSRVHRDHPRCCSTTWIGTCCYTATLLYSLGFVTVHAFSSHGGRNLPFPITLAIGFNNSFYYCTSRDKRLQHNDRIKLYSDELL